MSRRAWWAAVIVAFLLFVSVFVWRTGVAADATEDTKSIGCSTRKEVWITPVFAPDQISKAQLENRWVENKTHGRRIWVPVLKWIRIYPLCNEPTRFAVAKFRDGRVINVGIYTPDADAVRSIG